MIKISRLEVENIKRIKAVSLEPTPKGLTVIGGRNGQGKTSVLDAIAWVLGGEKFRPSEPYRDGSTIPPELHIALSNGLIVERKGKNGSLKVLDPTGTKGGQQLLNEFISTFALDLPRFLNGNDKQKADSLLQIIGVQDELAALDMKVQKAYNKRHEIGIIADQKKKYAEELDSYPEAPKEPVSASELIQQQQAILAKNGENQRLRARAEECNKELAAAQLAFDDAKSRLKMAEQNAVIARKSTEDLQDESTAELEASIKNIDDINTKVRSNMTKAQAIQDADVLQEEYKTLSEELDQLRANRLKLLNNTQLPLEGLSVNEKGCLTYQGFSWDNMSGADKLKVSTAIVRKLNPQCGFVLMDKLEQMDVETLAEFGAWAEKENLQIIATRVSTGKECSVIIEDGYIKQLAPEEAAQPEPAATRTWKAGEF